jgi:hypothetical protein
MGLLDGVLLTANLRWFDEACGFAESVTYRKRDGTTRSIFAVVAREPVEQTSAGAKRSVRVEVRNDATLGISMSELDRGTDEIQVAADAGGTAYWMRVASVETSDSGTVRMILR